jgi:hypothetical protein
MTNIRILVQEGMKKALRLSKKPSLSKRDVKTILKAVASQARRIKKMDKELPYGAETPGFKDKSKAERKGMEAQYNALRRNIASLGAPFPEGGEAAALFKRDAFSRRGFDTTFHRGRRIRAGYPETPVSGSEEMSGMQAFPGGGMEISNLPDLPGSPGTLNRALKGLPDKVGQTVYDPEKGPLQPDKKLTARMRGLEGLKKKFSQTTAHYPTRRMAAELEAHKKVGDLKGVQNYMKRLDQKRKLRQKLPNALVPPMVQFESVDNPKDGADVVANFYSERENSLLDSMKRQNRQAKQKMMKKYGVPYKPTDQKKIPKPINFRAEAVEMDAIRARRKLDKQIARDPNVGMHGPSHPMFHKSDLAKRVRGLEKRHKARRERIAQRDAENSSPVTDPMRARLIRAINKGNEQ